MQFFKLVFSFAPWLSFMIIAHDSLFRLKLGLVTALVMSVVMGVLRLHRGVILWVGLAFFSYATIAVLAFENMWTVKYMGILAHASLCVGTWYTVLVKRPFTLEYAREQVDPALWNSRSFIQTNMIITAAWGGCFAIGALIAWHKVTWQVLPNWGYEIINYSLMISCMIFSTAYPAYLRRASTRSA